jgi:2-desacetyl-2-hydroxyethyl bacteriochlorophyllide A dehydrogenase
MTQLGLSLTANQNSIPRELVFDIDEMKEGRLDKVEFKFIGGTVPEGHQGQSVQGMSIGTVIEKLKSGFHHNRIPYGFNAGNKNIYISIFTTHLSNLYMSDHQPIGGKFDAREDALVQGSLFATYITFDLSPELSLQQGEALLSGEAAREWCREQVPGEVLGKVVARSREFGGVSELEVVERVAYLWRAVRKMKARDEKYALARERSFAAEVGRAYFRELSIDELPGLTTRATLVTSLALCEALGMKIHFIAPAFGFQKNFPFPDDALLRARVEEAFAVTRRFQTSIGFHSGSGKSAGNYRTCAAVTGPCLEIKTSGRYTYEMGRALAASSDPEDARLWREWYAFTVRLAVDSCFAEGSPDERAAARGFVEETLGARPFAFATRAELEAALAALAPSPDHMIWFEYNFLFVLAASGRADKGSLGDHGPAGYAQRARFYAISEEAKLLYARNVASYIIFLAETTGKVTAANAEEARRRLAGYRSYAELRGDIYAGPAGSCAFCGPSLAAPDVLRMQEMPPARLRPGPGQALVRVHAVGVCGTDYHAFKGRQPFFSYPRVLGHELGVEVLELGDSGGPADADGLTVGARCAVQPYLHCGACRACATGKTNCCESLKVLGVHVDGGFLGQLIVPRENLHATSAGLTYEQLAVVEPLTIGAHGVRRGEVGPGDRVAVVGAGPVGIAVVVAARAAGAAVVVVSDVNDHRLAYCASRFGALPANPTSATYLEDLRAACQGDLPDVVIDATGFPPSMNRCFDLVRNGGRVVFVGLHKEAVTFDDSNFHRREVTLCASRNSTAEDFRAVLRAVEAGKVDTAAIITHTCTKDQFLDVFNSWSDPQFGCIKGIVKMTE